MILTEEEAETKWCPMARLAQNDNTYNRCGPLEGLNCIASACMMWRPAGKIGDNPKRGYCGLAGPA